MMVQLYCIVSSLCSKLKKQVESLVQLIVKILVRKQNHENNQNSKGMNQKPSSYFLQKLNSIWISLKNKYMNKNNKSAPPCLYPVAILISFTRQVSGEPLQSTQLDIYLQYQYLQMHTTPTPMFKWQSVKILGSTTQPLIHLLEIQKGASSDSSQTSPLAFDISSPSSSIESLIYSLCAKRSHSVIFGSSRS